MRRAIAQRGFTLVEVLVAMAIFALLVSVLYSSLGSVTRAYDAAEKAVDEGARLRIGAEFLSRLIETAYPVALADGRRWVVQFDGDEESLRLMVDMPGYVGSSGVHEVRLDVREEDGESALWFAWRPMMVDEDGERIAGEFQDRMLVPGVAGMAVRYFGAEDPEQDPRWSEQWSGMPALPVLVELSLEDEDETPWPVLVLRPRANTLRYLSVRKGGRAPTPEQTEEENPAPSPQLPGQEEMQDATQVVR